MNLIELTRKLIDIPSITGEEQEVSLFLRSFLTDLGYRVELNELAAGRCNVIASLTDPTEIVLSTHMDTVPPHIQSSEDEEFVYGRGACDAKGIIAAQILAAERLRADGYNNVGLLFTVDEEAGSDGAQVANRHAAAASCRYLINGEPTDNKLAIGSKGSLRLRLKTQGRAAHSAYPEHGHSAIETLLDVLADVRKIDWPNYDFFGETTCNIGTIKGGVRPNVIPESAEAELQIRLTTASSQVKEVLEQAVSNRAEIEYLSASEPMRMLDLAGFESCIVRFTTDIPHLSNWGKPLLLGPGSIFDAHTAHEKVSKAELATAVDLYVGLVHELTSKQP